MRQHHNRYARPAATQRSQHEIEATAGWSRPFDGATWHYFKRGTIRSLCGGLLYSGSPRDDSHDDDRDGSTCRTCQEQVQALRKAGTR